MSTSRQYYLYDSKIYIWYFFLVRIVKYFIKDWNYQKNVLTKRRHMIQFIFFK